MSNKPYTRWWYAVAVILGVVLLVATPQPATSQTQADTAEPGCIHCHEDLYYLHDTGKWFCLSESPMQCVGCHGGDPAATTKEAAHQNRTAHPIINGDTTTCKQCHIDDCDAHVAEFDAIAGISPVVLVSTPIGPARAPAKVVTPAPQVAEQATPVWDWPVALAIAILALGLAVLGWRRLH